MEAQVLDNDPQLPPGEEADIIRLKRMVEVNEVEEARAFVKQLQERWPESEKVRRWSILLAPAVVRSGGPASGRNYDVERKWVQDHAHEHPGKWLAVLGSELLTTATSFRELNEILRQHPEWHRPYAYFQPTE